MSGEKQCDHPAIYGIGYNHTHCASCGEKLFIDKDGKRYLFKDKNKWCGYCKEYGNHETRDCPEALINLNPAPTDLAPCPFCGGRAIMEIDHNEHLGSRYAVFCESCFMQTIDFTQKDMAVTSWNRRNEPQPPQDLAPCCGKRWDEHLGIVGTCQELRELKRVIELLEEDNGIFGVTTQTTASFALYRLEEQRKHIAALDANNSSAYKKINELEALTRNLTNQLAVANNMVEQLGDQVAEMDNEEIESVRRLTAANKRIEELENRVEAAHRLIKAHEYLNENSIISMNSMKASDYPVWNSLVDERIKAKAEYLRLNHIADMRGMVKSTSSSTSGDNIKDPTKFVPQEKGEGEG